MIEVCEQGTAKGERRVVALNQGSGSESGLRNGRRQNLIGAMMVVYRPAHAVPGAICAYNSSESAAS